MYPILQLCQYITKEIIFITILHSMITLLPLPPLLVENWFFIILCFPLDQHKGLGLSHLA